MPSEDCKFSRKLCVTCYTKNSNTWIRVQTNSFPSHCLNSDVTPEANNIDFEVLYMPKYSDWSNVNLGSLSALNTQVCTFNKPSTTPPRSINKILGNYNGIVGISLTGVPLFAGLTESSKDPWYPLTTPDYRSSVDECYGDANSNNKFYHYLSYSPCIESLILKSANQIKMCSDSALCSATPPKLYMQS